MLLIKLERIRYWSALVDKWQTNMIKNLLRKKKKKYSIRNKTREINTN